MKDYFKKISLSEDFNEISNLADSALAYLIISGIIDKIGMKCSLDSIKYFASIGKLPEVRNNAKVILNLMEREHE